MVPLVEAHIWATSEGGWAEVGSFKIVHFFSSNSWPVESGLDLSAQQKAWFAKEDHMVVDDGGREAMMEVGGIDGEWK